jgi:hypothetical protein
VPWRAGSAPAPAPPCLCGKRSRLGQQPPRPRPPPETPHARRSSPRCGPNQRDTTARPPSSCRSHRRRTRCTRCGGRSLPAARRVEQGPNATKYNGNGIAAGCWLLLAHFSLLGCCWLFLGSPICTKTADQNLRSGDESSFSLNRKLNHKTGALGAKYEYEYSCRERAYMYAYERFYGCFAPASRAAACLRSGKSRSQSGFEFQ